jgi:hypothetical protein
MGEWLPVHGRQVLPGRRERQPQGLRLQGGRAHGLPAARGVRRQLLWALALLSAVTHAAQSFLALAALAVLVSSNE